jgi:hypothetical protein
MNSLVFASDDINEGDSRCTGYVPASSMFIHVDKPSDDPYGLGLFDTSTAADQLVCEGKGEETDRFGAYLHLEADSGPNNENPIENLLDQYIEWRKENECERRKGPAEVMFLLPVTASLVALVLGVGKAKKRKRAIISEEALHQAGEGESANDRKPTTPYFSMSKA